MLSVDEIRANERRLEEILTYIAAPARGKQPLPRWIVDDLLTVAENFRADRAEREAEVGRLERTLEQRSLDLDRREERIVDLMAEVGQMRAEAEMYNRAFCERKQQLADARAESVRWERLYKESTSVPQAGVLVPEAELARLRTPPPARRRPRANGRKKLSVDT